MSAELAEREMAIFRARHATLLERYKAVIPAHRVLSGEIRPSGRKGAWMLTSTGRVYWPMDPRSEDVNIEDIAHALSMQCRYGGHSGEFYSVAEHSVYVSQWVPQKYALVALLHDATEAYVADVPRPLKPFLANYAHIEQNNWQAIAQAFELSVIVPECVHDIDTRICLTEMRRLMPTSPLPLGIEGEAPEQYIYCYSPAMAKQKFLERFDELWSKRMDDRYPAAARKGA